MNEPVARARRPGFTRRTPFALLSGFTILSLIAGAGTPASAQTAADSSRIEVVSVLSAEDAGRLEEQAEDETENGSSGALIRLTGSFTDPDGGGGIDPRLKAHVRLPFGHRSEAALSTERDPGEPFRWQPSRGWYGPDHVVGFVSHERLIREAGVVLIAGSYRAVFGHGLASGNGSRPILTAGGPVVSPGVRSDARGYAGFSERPARSGLVLTVDAPSGWRAGVFASDERLTASIVSDETDIDVVRGVSTSGLHESEASIDRRGRLRYRVHGYWAVLSRGGVSLGLMGARSILRSDIPLSDAIVRARRTILSASAAVRIKACQVSSETVFLPGMMSEVIGRCRASGGLVFGEWMMESAGPVSLYGRSGRLLRTEAGSSRLRAGWTRSIRRGGRSTRARIAVSGTILRMNSDGDRTGKTGFGIDRTRSFRMSGDMVRGRLSASLAVRSRWRPAEVERDMLLAGERVASGRMIALEEMQSSGVGLSVGMTFGRTTELRLGHLRSRTALGGPGSPHRLMSGTSAAVRVAYAGFRIESGFLTSDADECFQTACARLAAPRIYIHESGVRNSFGLASAGEDGHRWYATATLFPARRVTVEVQARHRSSYHADFNERRAARIGAPPAETTYTFQLTFR